MQKQSKLFILIALMFLFSPEFVSAGIISLPRYTGEFAYRSNSGGRDKTCSSSYKYTCSGTGYTSGSGTSCDDKYQSCVCAANYKWSGGACVLKGCSDYGYSASEDTTKSCTKRNPRTGLDCWECSSCNSTTYKYTCSGGLNASTQGTTNKCGTNYSECECVEHASWNSSSGKCECGSDYKASGTSCVLKGCTDYNSSYLTTEDKTKSCTKLNPRSGLECWNCSACTGTLYDCGNMANASGGSGTACGGKYPQCTCKSGYFWDKGACTLSCTPKACTGAESCNGQSCEIFKSTAITTPTELGTGIGTYEVCKPTNCSGTSNQYGYLPTGCADGYAGYEIGGCAKPMSTDCAELGYKSDSCSSNQSGVKCPFGNKYVCFDKPLEPITCENEDIGWILHGNGLCAPRPILELTPVAVIFDIDNRIAVSLSFIDKNGTAWDGVPFGQYEIPDGFSMPWTYNGDNVEDIPGLENCYVGMLGFYACGASGQNNTNIIIARDAGRNIYHAALATRKFTPQGCTAGFCQKGKWWLPSNDEIGKLVHSAYTTEVDASLYDIFHILGTTTFPVDDSGFPFWSSTEANNAGQGAYVSTPEYTHTGKYDYRLVRPVVRY